MCMCGKPTINKDGPGEYGLSWRAPELPEECALIYDEPGRCSPMLNGVPYKVDHHSHHYRMFKDSTGSYRAFVKHGMGTVEFGDSYRMEKIAKIMATMDSDARFILFMTIEGLITHAEREAKTKAANGARPPLKSESRPANSQSAARSKYGLSPSQARRN